MADTFIDALPQALTLNATDYLVVEQQSSGTAKAPLSMLDERFNAGTGALSHNSKGRGISLGTSVTSAQWTAIGDGSFADMFIGDYWTINGTVYRIAAFDYYYGKRSVSDHHVVIVPDTCMSDPVNMAATATNADGFNGALTYLSTELATVKSTITGAFGATHLLTHNLSVSKTVDFNGIVSAFESVASDVTFPTIGNVYGATLNNVIAPISGANWVDQLSDDDSIQFPLFRFMPEKTSVNNSTGNKKYWLRDAYGTDSFVGIYEYGYYASVRAYLSTPVFRIRPVFCIKEASS